MATPAYPLPVVARVVGTQSAGPIFTHARNIPGPSSSTSGAAAGYAICFFATLGGLFFNTAPHTTPLLAGSVRDRVGTGLRNDERNE